MTPQAFNAFCGSLPHATHVVQWGGAHVWKVGGKLFAVMWDGDDPYAGITFKASPMAYELLRTEPGLRPAPYLASRGLKWIQWVSAQSMGEDDLLRYLRHSHDMVFAALPRRTRLALTGGTEAATPSVGAGSPRRRAPGSPASRRRS